MGSGGMLGPTRRSELVTTLARGRDAVMPDVKASPREASRFTMGVVGEGVIGGTSAIVALVSAKSH